jgi:hypothetical protein
MAAAVRTERLTRNALHFTSLGSSMHAGWLLA